MKNHISDKNHQFNYLISEIDAIYHEASIKLALSDSAMRVLYTISDCKGECFLNDIYKMSGISKQTVNSAVRKLENEDIIYLENYDGRAKKVFLTAKGKLLAEQTVQRLLYIETQIFASWTEEELDLYISLTRRYAEELKKKISLL